MENRILRFVEVFSSKGIRIVRLVLEVVRFLRCELCVRSALRGVFENSFVVIYRSREFGRAGVVDRFRSGSFVEVVQRGASFLRFFGRGEFCIARHLICSRRAFLHRVRRDSAPGFFFFENADDRHVR